MTPCACPSPTAELPGRMEAQRAGMRFWQGSGWGRMENRAMRFGV